MWRKSEEEGGLGIGREAEKGKFLEEKFSRELTSGKAAAVTAFEVWGQQEGAMSACGGRWVSREWRNLRRQTSSML